MQVLEGDALELEQLFGVISADNRHSDVTLITMRRDQLRLFPTWSMAFANIGEDAVFRDERVPLIDSDADVLIEHIMRAADEACAIGVPMTPPAG